VNLGLVDNHPVIELRVTETVTDRSAGPKAFYFALVAFGATAGYPFAAVIMARSPKMTQPKPQRCRTSRSIGLGMRGRSSLIMSGINYKAVAYGAGHGHGL
jgi:hypothetical protein